jgi:hypothetical protein
VARPQPKISNDTFARPMSDANVRHSSTDWRLSPVQLRPVSEDQQLAFNQWRHRSFVRRVVIFGTAVGAPLAIGIASHHVLAGATISAIALLIVGLIAFGLFALDSTLP